MAKIKRARIWKQGTGYVVSIPTALIKCDVINPKAPIDITLIQTKEDRNRI